MPTSLAVFPTSQTVFLKAKEIATKLALPLVTNLENAGFSLILAVTEERLEIRKLIKPKVNPIYVDFLYGRNAYRNKFGKNSELIAKAIGIKGNYKPFVLDGTAGFGGDSFVLANLGCKVLMLECSPIIAMLLEDGLNRYKSTGRGFMGRQEVDDLLANSAKYADKSYFKIKELQLTLLNMDTKEYLQNILLANNVKPDVIYLDPMYPTINQKSAAPKVQMSILREIVGDDEDADDILKLALECANKRVVIKRPRTAKSLCNLKPDIVFEGASSRFDVYLCLQNKT